MALKALHAAGVLHPDIKPDAMLLLHEGQHLLLSDFDVSSLSSTTAKDDPLCPTLEQRHAHTGAPAHRSPFLDKLLLSNRWLVECQMRDGWLSLGLAFADVCGFPIADKRRALEALMCVSGVHESLGAAVEEDLSEYYSESSCCCSVRASPKGAHTTTLSQM